MSCMGMTTTRPRQPYDHHQRRWHCVPPLCPGLASINMKPPLKLSKVPQHDLVTDIQWPRWLKIGQISAGPACPQRRNRNETWGGPSELSGARQAARCLYDAGEPSWARSRCYSSSRQPIQYTACVGLSLIFHKVTVTAVGKKRKKDGN